LVLRGQVNPGVGQRGPGKYPPSEDEQVRRDEAKADGSGPATKEVNVRANTAGGFASDNENRNKPRRDVGIHRENAGE